MAYPMTMRWPILPAVAALWSCCAGAMADDAPQFWFSSASDCGGARVTVRSHCEAASGGAGAAAASCTEQELVVVQPGRATVRRDLLEHEPVGDDFHLARTLRCVAAGPQPYLLIGLDTGGSCDGCEISAVLALDGRWKRYGRHWLAPAAEQRLIRAHEAAWRTAPATAIVDGVREAP